MKSGLRHGAFTKKAVGIRVLKLFLYLIPKLTNLADAYLLVAK